MKNHCFIDERSLAFDRLIVEKLRSDPALLEKARSNLARWLLTCSAGVRPALIEWQQVLAGSFEEILALLLAKDERATRLRQSSPFCGILKPEERLAILREFQAYESAAA